ncbi:uncharacterized protein FOMMEDRAFT_30439 [Fomitiporia mediterranea MF3/22]|uniref:uncharacterized protein n=1 Tax=Fomitiporia mediterranea (strain MF3/22) TaxID=694068 RepID=UPI0004407A52|nr:uncharacterized protein FOMMEDRAFT_30439 [Fomitiporia mediterranea MF3/22]EJD00367.1 hypothetical protein FOMMEDRAFT_30439 [Fomitiporia mediterranea MF3/22]
MSTLYAQRNRVSRRFPRQKTKGSGESATVTNNNFQEINDAVIALNKVLNEKCHFEDSVDRKEIIDSLNNATRNKSKTSKTKDQYEPTIGDIGEGIEIERAFRAPNAVRLIRLYKINYRKLRSQFRNALIVLGVRKELYNDHLQHDLDDGHRKWADTSNDWKLHITGIQLENAHFQDSMRRFRDEFNVCYITVFPSGFNSNSLQKFTVIHYNRLYLAAARYQFPEDGTMIMNAHIDLTLEPLANALEDVLKEFTDITEQVIQRSEQYSNQRYLNLTTIATFLSSVTATTLQISTGPTGGPDSVLAGITNEFWFISLVFSMASATQSLIIMIWRQSFRRQPQEVFPSVVWKWFRNGPIYSLAIAMISFFVALCLLAFLVDLPASINQFISK